MQVGGLGGLILSLWHQSKDTLTGLCTLELILHQASKLNWLVMKLKVLLIDHYGCHGAVI